MATIDRPSRFEIEIRDMARWFYRGPEDDQWGVPAARKILERADGKIGSLRRTLSGVDRMLRSQGHQAEQGYFFRGLQDPEMGLLAARVRETLEELDACD